MSRLLLFYALVHHSCAFTATNYIQSSVITKLDSSGTRIRHKKLKCCEFRSTKNNHEQHCLNRKWYFSIGDSCSRTALYSSLGASTTRRYENNSEIERNDIQNSDINTHANNVNANPLISNGEINVPDNSVEMFDEDEKRNLKMRSNRIKVSMATSSMFTAFLMLIFLSGPGQWRYYLAGGICAAISHSITTPLDVIKTRKQLDESMKDMGFIRAGVKIIKNGGVTALLAGLGPTTIGYLLEGAVKFGIYEVSKPMVRSLLVRCATLSNVAFFDSKLLGFIISGTLAGTAASIMLCPMEALRIRLVAEPDGAAKISWVDCGIKMINDEGIMGFFKSLSSMLFKQVPYTVAKNVSFDFITTTAYCTYASMGRIICGRTKFIIPLVSAMSASVISSISSQPGDMLLSVINAQKGKSGTRYYIKRIMKENGIGGFFVGTRERLVHVGTIVTVQLLIYDFVKRLVGISATGL